MSKLISSRCMMVEEKNFWPLEVCDKFFHPVQESNRTTRTQDTWHTGKISSCDLLELPGKVMPKSEAGQVWRMITKGCAEYHILLQIPEVDAIKSAWYVPQASNGKQLFTIIKRARENLDSGKCFKDRNHRKQTYKQ